MPCLKRIHDWRRGTNNKICTGCELQEINTRFLPCNHFVLCLSCSSQTRVCPKCKKSIWKVQYDKFNDVTSITMTHHTLMKHCSGVEKLDLAKTPQIVLVGDTQADKHVILEAVLQECSLQKTNYENHLPVQRMYKANACIDNDIRDSFRMSVMDGVGWDDGEQMLFHLQALKPDVVVVCVSVTKSQKKMEFLRWRDMLGYMHGIDVIWLLTPDKVHGNGNKTQRTYFEQWLIRTKGASEMINNHYLSMVGGMAAVTPHQLAKNLLLIANDIRGDYKTTSQSSESMSALSDF